MTRAKFRFVFFDVDSTLVTIEGVDELARGNAAVIELTRQAKEGELPLEEVYARRLELARPSRQDVEALGRRYVDSMVEGAAATIDALTKAGAHVRLVSAGVAQALAPLAEELRIAPRNVHAVELRFDAAGSYAGYDDRSFLTRQDGKELLVRSILARSKGRSAFVGDGVTDLATRGVVDLFIGFGGVQKRPAVREAADVYVDGPSIAAVLPYLTEEA